MTSIKGQTKAFLNQTISVTYEVNNQAIRIPKRIRSGCIFQKAQPLIGRRSSLEGNHLLQWTCGRANQEDHQQGDHTMGGLSGLYYYGGVVGSSASGVCVGALVIWCTPGIVQTDSADD